MNYPFKCGTQEESKDDAWNRLKNKEYERLAADSKTKTFSAGDLSGLNQLFNQDKKAHHG